MNILSRQEQEQIAEILARRANEIAAFNGEYTSNPTHFGSVSLALSREILRLRHLADRVCPPEQEDTE